MALLRLLADILLYLSLGSLVYWFFTNETNALLAAIGCGIASALLFMLTSDIKKLQRQRKTATWDIWDFWFISDLLEIPFWLIVWLFKSLWRVFD